MSRILDQLLTLHILAAKKPMIDFVDDIPVVIINKVPMPYNVFAVLVAKELYRIAPSSRPPADSLTDDLSKSLMKLWATMKVRDKSSPQSRPLTVCRNAIVEMLYDGIDRSDILAVTNRVRAIDEDYARAVALRNSKLVDC